MMRWSHPLYRTLCRRSHGRYGGNGKRRCDHRAETARAGKNDRCKRNRDQGGTVRDVHEAVGSEFQQPLDANRDALARHEYARRRERNVRPGRRFGHLRQAVRVSADVARERDDVIVAGDFAFQVQPP